MFIFKMRRSEVTDYAALTIFGLNCFDYIFLGLNFTDYRFWGLNLTTNFTFRLKFTDNQFKSLPMVTIITVI